MNVVFSILSGEPIENVITCLNRRIDRIVFFGPTADYLESGLSRAFLLRQKGGAAQ